MDIVAIGAWGELIGGLGVVASLIFIGFQVRQNTSMMKSQTMQEVLAGSRETLLALTQLDYFGKPENELTPTDVRTRRAWNLANMRNMENQFYQQKTGLMDEDLVEAYRYFVGRWWTNLDDEFRELLASEMQYVFSKSFMAYVRDAGEAFSSDP